MRRRGRFDIVLGRRRHAGDVQKLLIHLVDRSGADDQLQLSVRLEHTFDAFHIVEVVLVDLAVVLDHQPESCRAVRGLCDILTPTDVVDDFLRALPVIQCHKSNPFPKQPVFHGTFVSASAFRR